MDSQYVIYTGVNLPYLDVVGVDNENLEDILGKINTAVNDMNPAPDYSGFNLYCITQTDGVTHPTNTENFAEGISKIVCDNKDEYDTFVDTTYPAAQAVLTAAITALQEPGYTYAPFSITNVDDIDTVWSKSFSGFTAITASIDPTTSVWGDIGAADATTIVDAFDTIIAYELTQDALIAGKQDAIATFNNTANCLSGGATDSIRTTVASLITYVCALPEYDNSAITWGGVTAATDLESAIQNLADGISYLLTNGVVDAGTGLSEAAVGTTYQGKKLSIDTTWTGLYKVKTTVNDTTPSYLTSKITAGTGISLVTNNPGANEDLEIVNDAPADGKVYVNASDSATGYLEDKIVGGSSGTWGLGAYVLPASDNSNVAIMPTVTNPNLLFQNMMYYIASDPTLLTQFANLVATSSSVPGLAITDLVVTLDTGNFDLNWTAQSGNSQQAKWRQRGNALWEVSSFTPANPLSAVAVTTEASVGVLNSPLQFQVDTIYSAGLVGSNIYESILYDCQSLNVTVLAGVISVNQSAMSDVSYLEYNLYDSGPTLVETIITTGSSPAVQFASVGSGTYSVEWRMGTTINGSMLYSDDASQLNAYCTETGIVVP